MNIRIFFDKDERLLKKMTDFYRKKAKDFWLIFMKAAKEK